MSRDDLAARLGLDVENLEAYEKNHDVPKIATLIRIAKTFQINVADIFRDRPAASEFEIVRQSENQKVNPLFEPSATKVKDYAYLPLTLGGDDKHMDAYLIEIPAHQGKKPHENLTHPGEEFVYMLEGKIAGDIGNEKFELGTGDSLYLRSHIPHYFYNPYDQAAKALTVIYPY